MLFAVSLPFLNEIVALFLVSVLIAYICYRIKLVPIAGFLIAGVIIGPNALGLVQDQELVDMLAEIGIILLLFTIGIEFSLEKLSRIRNAIFVGGGLQVLLTVAAVVGILFFFGVDWKVGIYTGCLVALSSTAIILGLFSEQGKTDTPVGRLSLAVLIFQDLAIIAMVLLVPILSGQSDSMTDLFFVLGKAVLLIAVVVLLARKVVPWILEKVAQTRRQELFLLTVIAICFGTAALTNLAEVSLALGAFLAGLVVSESHYSDHAISEILPLKTIFNAVFFVSVGMLLDLQFVIEHPLLLLGVAAGVLLLKFILSSVSLLTLGYPVRIAAASGIVLAQIGEFSFVLERAGRVTGLTPGGFGEVGSQTFIAVSVLLMLLTPLFLHISPNIGNLLAKTPLKHIGQKRKESAEEDDLTDLEDHVIIVGYGPAGRNLARVLRESGIPYIVIEMNPKSVNEMHDNDIPAIYGDASRTHILEHAQVSKAKLCVIAINDPSISPRIIKLANYINPTIQVIVRTRYLSEADFLEKAGADIVVPEEMETTVRLFSNVLKAYMIPDEEIEQHIRELRAEDYEIMRGSIQEAHLMVLQGLDEEGLHTRAVIVREGSFAAGKTLADLKLRNKYEITVLTVNRGEKNVGNPSGDFKLQPGDRLVMVGLATRFADAAEIFREPENPLEFEE
ncbi:MAG: cation:proton antiporter [Gracilimonas sp.]|uniref:monovalent cation:proton antiporter family protein n=1 Tax=Gracilimonas TaxID=649462 RepID=UPI001B1FCBF7|nr:monovalent cation:proton antiporter family protein [Gracilimonas sp.]MBO6586133.1 cation:proton antiporter [Gracilimonas sp.]MBO6614790.1 cation:proton antiporter [Gracilimonas sp.]